MPDPDFTFNEQCEYDAELSVTRNESRGYSLVESLERSSLITVDAEVSHEPWEVE